MPQVYNQDGALHDPPQEKRKGPPGARESANVGCPKTNARYTRDLRSKDARKKYGGFECALCRRGKTYGVPHLLEGGSTVCQDCWNGPSFKEPPRKKVTREWNYGVRKWDEHGVEIPFVESEDESEDDDDDEVYDESEEEGEAAEEEDLITLS